MQEVVQRGGLFVCNSTTFIVSGDGSDIDNVKDPLQTCLKT